MAQIGMSGILPGLRPPGRVSREKNSILGTTHRATRASPGHLSGGRRMLGEFGLEPLLTINLAVEHSLRQRAVVRWDLVDQHHPRESVAPVVESPTMHARHQPAERVLSLVELGRTATRHRDVFCRRLDEV